MKWICAIAAMGLVGSSALAQATDADLTQPAERALHGFMVNNPQRLPGPEGYYRFHFLSMGLPVPFLAHAQWDLGDCTGRAVEQWIQVRQMTGEADFGGEVEQGQRKLLLSLLDPKLGVVTVPELADRKTRQPYVQMWDQGRTLRALVAWWMTEQNPKQKEQLKQDIDRMIAGVQKFGTPGVDPTYGPYIVWHGDAFIGDRQIDDLCIMRGGQLLEPLAIYWQHSKDPAALDLARRVTAGVLSGHESDGYSGWLAGTLRFGADGSFTGHFHDHVSIAMGVARFGIALDQAGETDRGLEYIRWAKKVYDWCFSPDNPNNGASFGWFAENCGDSTTARQIDEICCLADMIQFAGVLASAAPLNPALKDYDALWDDVERFSTNTLLHRQFKITPAYAKLVNDYASQHLIQNDFLMADFDAQGTFDHLQIGHQTLMDEQGGHLSQFLYSVSFDGGGAAFAHTGGSLPAARNFRVTTPGQLKDNTFAGEVQTEDGKIAIRWQAVLGNGPYLVRTFTVRNISDEPLSRARLTCAANLDFTNFNGETGQADPAAGRVLITANAEPGLLALSGNPRPDYVRTEDATALLSHYDSQEWTRQPTHFEGNAAGEAGWDLGTLLPGYEKKVELVLAVVGSESDLDRALAGETFTPSAGHSDSVALAAARRQEGGWTACAYPDDNAYLNDAGQPIMHWMGCCHYSGVRGLYAAWEPTFDERNGILSIRLPLDRKGKLADQAIRQQDGQVTRRIGLHEECQVNVRIPDWVDLSKVRLRIEADISDSQVNPKPDQTNPKFDGHWLQLGKLEKGTILTISYPLTERTTQERVGGNNKSDGYAKPQDKTIYTIHWRGNQVQSISPAGDRLPVFAK